MFPQLSLSAQTTAGNPFAQLLINGNPSVFVNRQSQGPFPIPTGSIVLFNGGNTVSPNNIPALPTDRYQYVLDGNGGFLFREFSGGQSNIPGQTGPGTVYYDGDTALFTNSDSFVSLYNSISSQIPTPPSQVTIDTPVVNNEVVLNLESNPSNSNDENIVELSGSEAFVLSSGESLTYSSNTLRYRRGSVTQEVFNNINDVYVLQDISQNGQPGRRLRRFTGSANEVITGPGVLRVGRSPTNTNQRVAFFSPSSSVNQEIDNGIIDEQLDFVSSPDPPSAQIIDITGGGNSSLVELVGSRTFNYPTASQISFQSGSVRVFDSLNNQIGSLSNFDLNTFLNNEITSLSRSSTGIASFDVPDGGLTLITSQNSDTGLDEAFAYPSRNTIVTNRIQSVLSEVSIPTTPFPNFNIRSFSNGSAVLSVNGDDVVTVTDRPPFNIGSGQFCRYNGATSRIEVYNRANPEVTIASIPVDSLTLFESPNCLTTVSSTNPLNRDVAGPGVVYFDDQNRAFLTNEPRILNTITGFINSLPPAVIIPEIRTTNQTTVVDIVNNNRRLVEVNPPVTDLGTTGGVIYTDNTVRVVNGFVVPSDAQVVFNPTPQEIQVVSSDGNIIFSTPATGTVQSRQGGTINSFSSGTTLSGGGVIYFNPTTGNVVYNTDTTTTPELVTDLTNSGISFEQVINGITELNFYDGQRVSTFTTSSSTSFIPGPGVVFSTGNQVLVSTDTTRNIELIREISQINPPSVTVSTTTGTVRVTTATGTPVVNFTIGDTSEIVTVETSTIIYTNGVLMVDGRNITTNTVTTFDGVNRITFGTTDSVNVTGPGIIIVNRETNEVTIVTDPTTISRINFRIRNTPFVPPFVTPPNTNSLTSKFQDVSALFGQVWTNVYAYMFVAMYIHTVTV